MYMGTRVLSAAWGFRSHFGSMDMRPDIMAQGIMAKGSDIESQAILAQGHMLCGPMYHAIYETCEGQAGLKLCLLSRIC